MAKDIYRNKKDFGHEEFETEFYGHPGAPIPRESKSQKAQLNSRPKTNLRKDKKVPMADKLR